jgi:ubiquinone/menaquinone biosynthesis C-methylase UbiE
MGQEMTTPTPADQADQALKARHRKMWALGDQAAVSRDLNAPFGPRLVEACGIAAGQRVLDVGAGAGTVAIVAAATGASVVASDLTPELLDAGRREAAARGLQLEWAEGDAEALPFEDGEFDVVVSSVGAMFAPHHQRVADELVRVTKAGGLIGMINWVPDGVVGQLFMVIAPYAPSPPPGVESPFLWGDERHVRALFGDRVCSLEFSRETLVIDRFQQPLDGLEYLKEKYGPTIATYATLAGDRDRVAALDRDLAEFLTAWNKGGPDGPAIFDYEYLLVVARTNP